MTIQDLIDQFDIQGAYRIKQIDDDDWTCSVVAEGHDFECEYWDISDRILNKKIHYMYVADNALNIEVK